MTRVATCPATSRRAIPTRIAAPRVPVARPGAPSALRVGRRPGPTRPARQRGVALVVALVLLIATSLLAVSTLSGTRLSETMASNAQNKAIAFEVAESGIEAVWAAREDVETMLNAAPGNDPPARTLVALEAAMDGRYDQYGAGLVLDGTLTVQFCAERASVSGSELNGDLSVPGTVAYVHDIVSTVDQAGAGAEARHVQRAEFPGPKTGRTGACPAPR